MKKGVVNQVFIYIFVLIVIALVLFFGFKQIANLTNLGQKAVYITFSNDFKEAVDGIYYKNEGSVVVFSSESRNKPLILPDGVNRICFDNNNVILDSDKYRNFKIDKFINGNCIDAVNGKLSFKLENKIESGDTYILISAS